MTPNERTENPSPPAPDQRRAAGRSDVDGIVTRDGFFNRIRRIGARNHKITVPCESNSRQMFKALLAADLTNKDTIGIDVFLAFAFVLQQMVMNVSRSRRIRPEYHHVGPYGLFAVFGGVIPAAAFAWQLIEKVGDFDWESLGISSSEIGIRIALDAGLITSCRLSPLGPPIYHGIGVTIVNLIVPAVDSGSAFTSEVFSAHLNASVKHQFTCKPAGFQRLGLGHHEEYPLYKLALREKARYTFIH